MPTGPIRSAALLCDSPAETSHSKNIQRHGKPSVRRILRRALCVEENAHRHPLFPSEVAGRCAGLIPRNFMVHRCHREAWKSFGVGVENTFLLDLRSRIKRNYQPKEFAITRVRTARARRSSAATRWLPSIDRVFSGQPVARLCVVFYGHISILGF